jgi:hypothetical protein
MLWLRAIKQAARMVIHGLPMDNDEAMLSDMLNVTPEADQGATTGAAAGSPPAQQPAATPRPAMPKRSHKGAAAITATVEPAAAEPAARPATQGKIVDGELVDPKAEEAEKAKNLAAQLEAKERAEVAAHETAKGTPAANKERAMLSDGEKCEGVIEVSEVLETVLANLKQPDGSNVATPYTRAKVRGAFWGEVWHFGGATVSPASATPIALPCWAVGKKLDVKLFGKLNVSNGKVMVRVEQASEVQAASQPVDVD